MARPLVGALGTRVPVTASKALLLVCAVILAVLLETVARGAVRLPGHRAFPGALALLLFAELFPAWMLLGFAAATSTLLALVGGGHGHAWVLVGTWLLTAGVAAFATRKRVPAAISCLAVGALFGLLRWASTMGAPHHTAPLVRFGGHVIFGVLAGAVAWLSTRRGSQ